VDDLDGFASGHGDSTQFATAESDPTQSRRLSLELINVGGIFPT
jgi:hypothetical protein